MGSGNIQRGTSPLVEEHTVTILYIGKSIVGNRPQSIEGSVCGEEHRRYKAFQHFNFNINNMASAAHLRVARPTNNIASLIPFYCAGLGFSELFRFQDHDSFDGVMLGSPKSPYHFEFTTKAGHDAGRAPTQDNLLVFYLPDKAAFEAAVARMTAAGIAAVPAFNPYWDIHGTTFEDADGYRVVLAHQACPV